MIFLPLYDTIVLTKIEDDNKLNGIFIPKNENNILKGKIIDVGCGILLKNGEIKKLLVKKNDIVLFKDCYNIEKYKNNEVEYYFIKEKDIISIIK
ncbi:MAG: co-chaperone GroES family protein [Candidatus Carsonella ruddii]